MYFIIYLDTKILKPKVNKKKKIVNKKKNALKPR